MKPIDLTQSHSDTGIEVDAQGITVASRVGNPVAIPPRITLIPIRILLTEAFIQFGQHLPGFGDLARVKELPPVGKTRTSCRIVLPVMNPQRFP